MSLVNGENLKSLRGSLVRSLRYLKRVRDEIKPQVEGDSQGQDAVSDNDIESLSEKFEVFKGQAAEFNDLLSQFERLAAQNDDQTYATEEDEWAEVSFECKTLTVRCQKWLQRHPHSSNAPATDLAGSSTAPTADTNDSISRLVSLLENQQRSQPSQTPSNSSIAEQAAGGSVMQAKLPKLELPKFSGDMLNWKPFWDRFEASVDKNQKLAPVDKMSYLVSQLEKIPLKMVQSLPVTNENYPVAVDMLKKKYGDQRMAISLLYRKLNEMRVVKNEVVALRQFVSEIDCLLGSLSALGQNTTDDNFATIILSKLPNPVVVLLELAKNVNDAWSVAMVRSQLSDYLTKIERASNVSAPTPKPNDDDKYDRSGDSFFGNSRKKRNGQGQAKKFGRDSDRKRSPDSGQSRKGEAGDQRGSSPRCVYCNSGHWSDQCEKFKTADERYQNLGDRCVNCLRSGHIKRDCKSTKPCYYCKRVGNHHSSLCFNEFGRNRKPEAADFGSAEGQQKHEPESDEDKGQGKKDGRETGLLAAGERVTLQTALLPVSSELEKSTYTTVRALLDPGCNRSYCSESMAKMIGLRTSPGHTLTVNRFGSNKPVTVPTRVGKLKLKTLSGQTHVIEVSVINQISGSLTRAAVKSEKLVNLSSRLKLADVMPDRERSSPINLLIGSDYYLDFITGEKIEVSKGLYLLGSEFGYVLSGRIGSGQREEPPVSMCGFTGGTLDALVDLQPNPKSDPVQFKDPEVSDYWSLETIGIKDGPLQSDDQKAIEDFQRNVQFDHGRYSVSLPWNEKVVELQPDYNLCVGRLKSLVRQISIDDGLWDKYNQVLEDQVQKGVIEKVVENKEPTNQVHYIPHHAVVNPDRETTQLRIVYDGSAKTRKQGASLNESLYRGPILLEDLVGILLRFRLSPTAIISDIEKAFLQIAIIPKDRDMVRFLWLKDPTVKQVEGNIQKYRFSRVLFGLNCSPSLLAQVIHHHLKELDTTVARQILENLYVDNVFTGVESAKQAKEFYREAKKAFEDASMNLRSWSSNSKELMDFIAPGDKQKSTTVKVLGIHWDTQNDTFSVGGPSDEKLQSVQTKRDVLSAISSVFDPHGWFAPCTIPSKCLLQSICNGQKRWDSVLESEVKEDWQKKCHNLSKIQKVPIPRLVLARENVRLVAFCDASNICFATVIYLVAKNDDEISSTLLLCKSRLNPSKKLTIPRLELMGTLIGVRALKFVENQLKLEVTEKVLFSDSMCVLNWIKSPTKVDVFVRNRLSEIHEKANDVKFRYVKTDQNPADWASRGKEPEELSEFWWRGPSWLRKPPENWPDWNFPCFVPGNLESKPRTVHEAGLVSNDKPPPPFDLVTSNFSSVTKLLRVTAWCIRFVDRLKKRSPNTGPSLSVEEMTKSKLRWEVYVQKKWYGDVFAAIGKGQRHSMIQMGLFIDDNGVLRGRGRLGNSLVKTKFPKIMPAKDEYTELMVVSFHRSQGHTSSTQTLNALRQEYWIPRGRALVTKIVRRCVVCQKANGKPYSTPQMPELPSSRVNPHPSFERCGVDYFGPIKLRSDSGTQKAWVCLFTCLSTRAIHLELVFDLSAVEFLLALRRFIARRGKPKTMISDNGPQFKVASQVLDQVWSNILLHPDVTNFCANGGISWSFITEYAPFMGGVYERMVGLVKESLRKTIGQCLLTSQQFETLLCECEAIVNSRPLTYVEAAGETVTVITPAHFLNPCLAVASPEWEPEEDNFLHLAGSAQHLIQKWTKGQNLLNEFWRLWSSEYLSLLRERSRYLHRHSSRSPVKPQVGHLVLIKEAGLPRGSWRMGRITEVCESSDKEVRSVKVKLPSGRELKRPVGLLIPFETEGTMSEMPQTTAENATKSGQETNNPSQPTSQPVQVVMAKVRGFPSWPAKIIEDWSTTPLAEMKAPKDSIAVQFFKTGRFAFVKKYDVTDLDEGWSESRKSKIFKDAMTMAEQYGRESH